MGSGFNLTLEATAEPLGLLLNLPFVLVRVAECLGVGVATVCFLVAVIDLNLMNVNI
jgi:hypothetical protein